MNRRFLSAQWIVPVLILFLAFALRFYHLGDKGLWGDEIAQARWALYPLEKMWERFREPPDFILHFLFGQVALQFGTDALWIRLPSLLASMGAVAATYVVARRAAALPVAWLAMLLMAVSPFQIWYAQEARMYASLVCFATLSLYFFLWLLDKPQWRGALGLALANAAAMYTHLFGVLPALLEFVALCGIAAAALWRTRQTAARAKNIRQLIPRSYVLIVSGLLLAGVLALPLLPGTLPYVTQSASSASDVVSGEPPFQLSPGFVQLLLSDIGLAPDMGWRMGLSLALAILGFAVLARNTARGAWIFGVWLLLPILLLQITHPTHTVANRYLIFLQPVYLILIAVSVIALARGANARLDRVAFWRAVDTRTRFWFGACVITTLVLLFSAPPLRALYARAKLNDWQTLARFFETRATPGDVVFTEKDFWGLQKLAYYTNTNAFHSPPATLAELQAALAQDRTIWYMSFGGYYNPQQEGWVQKNLRRVDGAEWMRADLEYVPRNEFHFTQSEPLLEIYTRQGKIPSEIVYANELGDRARATPHLPLKPDDMLTAVLAKGGGARMLRVEYANQPLARVTVEINGERVAASSTLEHGETIVAEYPFRAPRSDPIRVQVENASPKTVLIKRIALE